MSAFLLETACKSVAIMAAVSALMFFWRRGAAATRHFVWFAFLCGLTLLPLGAVVGPAWDAPAKIIPKWIRAGELNDNAPPTKIVGELKRILPVAQKQNSDRQPTVRSAATPGKKIDWPQWIVFGWAMGVAIAVGRLFLRWAMLRGIERASREIEDDAALSLPRECRRELRIKRRVRLLESAQPLMPMTWGWWRPVVLLPSSISSWAPERLRFVLRHELAHVQRWDCLTQGFGSLVSALYWFNPFVWHAQRQMRLERERACDDVVLGLDARASDYAGHLLAVARQFGYAPRVAALPMARRSNLEGRVRALFDFQRKRSRLNPAAACGLALMAAAAAMVAGGCHSAPPHRSSFQNKLVRITPEKQRQGQINTLKKFAAAKEKQSNELAAKAGETISPEFQRLFDAATNGDSKSVLAMYENFHHRHRQYSRGTNAPDPSVDTPYWQPVLELCLAYDMVAKCEPAYTGLFANGIIGSIPAGSIYFGGTDPGRGIPTAFCKSHVAGDPFFTLTQNALADATYLKYLRAMYGKSIYTPSDDDAQRCFAQYMEDAKKRLTENKLKPGEDVKMDNGRVQISGQVAVMTINGLLVKEIFDKNPDREFYIEESFPLDWTYPHLEPHGLIMRIRREPMAVLPAEAISRDHKYWQGLADNMIGPWLRPETPVTSVAEFARKIWVSKDFAGFTGNPRFVQNDYACRAFSKLRSAIAGLYSWRIGALKDAPTPREYLITDPAQRERMAAEADFAFRQACALCPYDPEAITRYAYFLVRHDRSPEALLLAETAQRVQKSIGGGNSKFEDLISKLKDKTLVDPVQQSIKAMFQPVP